MAAGPVANLLLAVLLMRCSQLDGVQEPMAYLARPVPGSVASRPACMAASWCAMQPWAMRSPQPVRSFEDLRWLLTRGALESIPVRLEVEPTPVRKPSARWCWP